MADSAKHRKRPTTLLALSTYIASVQTTNLDLINRFINSQVPWKPLFCVCFGKTDVCFTNHRLPRGSLRQKTCLRWHCVLFSNRRWWRDKMSQRLVVGVLGFCWRCILFFTPNYDSSFTRARVLRRSVPRARTWRPRLCLSRNEEQLCSLTVPINSYTSTRLIWLIQSIDRKRPNIFREMPHISENATKLDGFIFFVCKLVRMGNARVFWILIQFNKNMLIRRIFRWLIIYCLSGKSISADFRTKDGRNLAQSEQRNVISVIRFWRRSFPNQVSHFAFCLMSFKTLLENI